MKKRSQTPVRIGLNLDVIIDDDSRVRLTPGEALDLAECLARRAFQKMAAEELRRSISGPRMWC